MRVIVIAPAGGEATHECDDDVTVGELRERLGAWRIAALPNPGTPFPVMPMRDASLVARYARLFGETISKDGVLRVAVLEQREVEAAHNKNIPVVIPPFQWQCVSCKYTHPDLQPRCASCDEERYATLYLEDLPPDAPIGKQRAWVMKTTALSGLQDELETRLGKEAFQSYRKDVVAHMTAAEIQSTLGGGYPALKDMVDTYIARR